MRCELDDGSVRQVRTTAELENAFAQMGIQGHIILGGDRGFVQVARNGQEAAVQYSEGEALYEAADAVGLETARQILKAFFEGDDAWKSGYQWDPVSSGGVSRNSEESPENTGSDGAGGQFQPGGAGSAAKGFGGMLADEAARAIKRGAGRAISQGLRRFIK